MIGDLLLVEHYADFPLTTYIGSTPHLMVDEW